MSSQETKNPTGGVNMGHVIESPDPNDHLLERILSKENVLKAWKRVKANKGAPGVDNMSIEEFPEFAHNHWANILLDDLDKELERRGHRFVRYADDFIILVKSQRAGERVMLSVQRFLERKLKVNHDKSQVTPTDKTNFLGFTFKGTKIRWSDKAFRAFKRRVKELTGRSWFVSMDYRLHKLAQFLRGWMNYFGISEYYRPIPEIDHWLRRRVRMCYWKQWRYARTKVPELRKLGTFLNAAISVAMSRKGPWHLARTLATQTGMTNQWLSDQGLLSVKELWVNIHYPTTAR